MYELKIRDYCFVAHSLKDEFFGPAKNLHGVTYVVDLIISSKELVEKNVLKRLVILMKSGPFQYLAGFMRVILIIRILFQK